MSNFRHRAPAERPRPEHSQGNTRPEGRGWESSKEKADTDSVHRTVFLKHHRQS